MKISVVIPCRNEVQYIEECITAIYHNKIDKTHELFVYVVDGMSDDGTREKVKSIQTNYANLFLVDNKKQLTPFAFNLGILQQKVDFVQIVGARHILSPNYMAECLQLLEGNSAIWCVGGKINNNYVNEIGEIISQAMSTSFGMGIGNFRTLDKSGFTDTVTSPMYPYWVFDKIGLFDEELIRNQDDDFNYRITKIGGKIYYENSISLDYYVRGNYKGLQKQFFQYGYWKVYVNRKHKAVTTLRQLVPPLFVAYCMSLFVALFFIQSILAQVYFLPMGMYLCLLVVNSLKLTNNLVKFWDFMKTFLILHFSYGFGYLKGILHFWVLKQKPSDRQKEMSR